MKDLSNFLHYGKETAVFFVEKYWEIKNSYRICYTKCGLNKNATKWLISENYILYVKIAFSFKLVPNLQSKEMSLTDCWQKIRMTIKLCTFADSYKKNSLLFL
jgi:hypothetical protein